MVSLLLLSPNAGSIVSIYYFSVFSYIIIFMNLFFILFNFNVFKLSSSQLFSLFSYNDFYFLSTILVLLSLAGIPPFFGFANKIFILILFFHFWKFFFFFIFLMVNFFIMYFYILNIRYLVSTQKNSLFFIHKFHATYNFKLHVCIIVLNLLNLFGIFFIELFLNFFHYIGTFYLFS